MGSVQVFKVGADFVALQKRILELSNKETLHKIILDLFARESQFAAANIIKTKLSGDPLHRRTGTLARSVVGQAEVFNGVPARRVGILRGPALAYAGIQEFGGTIKPVNAKALSIPMEPALTPAGVDRFGGPRNYPGKLRFLPFRRGIAVGKLVDDEEAKALHNPYEAEAVYLLLRSVTIKPKHYLRDGFSEYLPTFAKHAASFLASAIAHGQPTQ